jgi:hypothetical protein
MFVTIHETTSHCTSSPLYRCSGFGFGGLKPIGEYFDFFTSFSLFSFFGAAFCPKGVFPLKVIQESTRPKKEEKGIER